MVETLVVIGLTNAVKRKPGKFFYGITPRPHNSVTYSYSYDLLTAKDLVKMRLC